MERVESCPNDPRQKPIQCCQKHLLQCHTRGKIEKLERFPTRSKRKGDIHSDAIHQTEENRPYPRHHIWRRTSTNLREKAKLFRAALFPKPPTADIQRE